MGIFQNQRGMAEIRHNINVQNSVIKREKINGYPYAVICGCSQSCGFAFIRKHEPAPQPVAKEKKSPRKPPSVIELKRYREWLRTHQPEVRSCGTDLMSTSDQRKI